VTSLWAEPDNVRILYDETTTKKVTHSSLGEGVWKTHLRCSFQNATVSGSL
jgi:hypothetical protein